jgi:hypothetical protein
MATFIICGCDDLENDVELYANGIRATIVDEFSTLRAGDTAILYTHGQYYNHRQGPRTLPTANNMVLWGDDALTAAEMRDKLIDDEDLDLPNGVSNITLIVHACFTAGTVENPPATATRDTVFAGQLCAALKEYYYPGLRVIGYRGQSKAGRAGFRVGAPPETRRILRGHVDGNAGGSWQVEFGGDGDRDGFLSQGNSVTWT